MTATGPKECPNAMNQIAGNPAVSLLTNGAGYDPIEDRLRASVRATIETMFEEASAAVATAAKRKAIVTGTARGSSPAPSAPKPCGCRAPEWRTKRARSPGGARRRCRGTSG